MGLGQKFASLGGCRSFLNLGDEEEIWASIVIYLCLPLIVHFLDLCSWSITVLNMVNY